ncbi:MAG TPA: helix-turn-helix domain-containing protein [Candidatus Limnocylindria bacterium]|jgi:DNA-binding NtrC family response regulator|nr:helix-turn-helix domain-containing protein [Candidatus Limnocylindria bacterium]
MRPVDLLVLDADPQRRSEVMALLRGAGHHVALAPDAAAAAEALGRAGFELLVLDPAWPELDPARLREALAASRAIEPEPLDAAERRHIALTLRFTAGNKRRAAELLGIARSTLLHKVRKYGLTE